MKGINLQGNEWRQHSLVTPIPPLCVNKIHCLAALWYLLRFQVPRNPIEIRYPGYLVPLVNTSIPADNDFIHPCRLILSKCTDALGHKVLPPSPTDIKYQWGHFGTFEIRSLKFNLFRRGIYPHVFHEKCPRRKYSVSKWDLPTCISREMRASEIFHLEKWLGLTRHQKIMTENICAYESNQSARKWVKAT